jgi:hypothetical protein
LPTPLGPVKTIKLKFLVVFVEMRGLATGVGE